MSIISRSSTPLSAASGGAAAGAAGGGGAGPGSSNANNAASTSSAGSSSSSSLQAHLGVVRSRTLLFQSYRDSVPRNRSSRATPYSDHDDYLGAATGGSSSGRSSFDLKGKGKSRAGNYFDTNGDFTTSGSASATGTGEEERRGLLDGAADPGTSSYPPRQGGGHTSIDLSTLPPKWVDTSEEVDSLLASVIRPKMAQLDKLHAKHLLPSFADRTHEEREIEQLTTQITREFRTCSKLISALAQHTQQSQRRAEAAAARRRKQQQQQQQQQQRSKPGEPPDASADVRGLLSPRELALAQNVQTALATRVQDLSGVFRKKQSVYLQRLKGLEVRGRDLAAASGMLSKNGRLLVHRDNEAAVREDMELVSLPRKWCYIRFSHCARLR